MSVAWITSFSDDLYQATGRSLVESYERSQSCGKLFIAGERLSDFRNNRPEKVIMLPDPGDSSDLQVFVANNKDIIPKEFGGSWTGPCKCPNPNDPKDKRHKAGCPGSWFCKHAIRWFRKFLALRSFMQTNYLGYRYVIWIDSDVIFKKKVSEPDVAGWCKKNDVFFLKGPKRKIWETGIVGFTAERGLTLVQKAYESLQDGTFRKFPRWDDSYTLQTTAESMPSLKTIDLATGASGHADVVPHSPLHPFLAHNKGTHGRGLGIMK